MNMSRENVPSDLHDRHFWVGCPEAVLAFAHPIHAFVYFVLLISPFSC